MLASEINLKIHIVFWLLLTLYPAATGFIGSVSTAQRLMHPFFMLYIILCVVLFYRTKVPMGRNLFDIAIFYFLINVAYYGIVTLINGKNIAGTGLFDIFRPLVYFSYLLLPFLFPLDVRQFKKILNVMLLLCLLQVAFSTMVYFDILWPLVDIYKGRKSNDILLFQFFRWSGTSGYPSDFSFILSFFIYFIFFSLRRRLYSRKTTIITLIILLVALLMTLSRGGLATVAVMLMFALLLERDLKNIFYFGAIVAVFSIITYVSIYAIDSQMFNVKYVWELLEHGVDSASAHHRVNEIHYAWKYATEMFPIGIGPDKARMIQDLPVIESLYGHLFIKWGILGYLFYFLSILFLGKLSYNLWKTHEDMFIAASMGALFLLIISVPLIFGFSSAITDRFKGLPFFYTLIGYLLMLYESNKRRYKGEIIFRSGSEITVQEA